MLGSWTSWTVGELVAVEVVGVDGGIVRRPEAGWVGVDWRRLMAGEVVTWEEELARMFMAFDCGWRMLVGRREGGAAWPGWTMLKLCPACRRLKFG